MEIKMLLETTMRGLKCTQHNDVEYLGGEKTLYADEEQAILRWLEGGLSET